MTREEFNKYVEFLNTDITFIKGVGEKRAKMLHKLGIRCVWDLLYYFPRDYEDRRKVHTIISAPIGEMCCIKATPNTRIVKKQIKRNVTLYYLYVEDDTGSIHVKWFGNDTYPVNISYGEEYIFYGKKVYGYGKTEFELEVMEKVQNAKYTMKIVPNYPLTKGLNQNLIRSLVSSCLTNVERFLDIFTEDIRDEFKLETTDFAIRQMHFPSDDTSFSKARKKLVFEELFILQLALSYLKGRRQNKKGILIHNIKCEKDFEKLLPFTLTESQSNAIGEILSDLSGDKPMNRLVQGDVGCGKTVVAAAAIYTVCKNGYQSALMAPTEILATQHFNTLKNIIGDNLNIALLTGSTKAREKRETLEKIKNGEIDLVIGTHAIIEDTVEFKSLALCVTDEQHRFGVNQRAKLSEKSDFAHVLVMSATPIPRTLALILYGDLDISVINAMPKGRQPIETYCVTEGLRQRAYNFVKKQLDEGRQGYIVCPLVEQSDKIDARSSVEIYENLKDNVFPSYRVGLLHGKMNAKEKDAVMLSFKNGDIDLLVSTTVIEVGVDVPNANIMVIENAERFGLSQLHQLRGRVGRGSVKSYCVLFTDSDNEITRQRMDIMTSTTDGFKISQKDLELRGSGEFFGTRQHGLPELKVANLFTDMEILKEAQKLCQSVLETDPTLSDKSHLMMKQRIAALFKKFENNDIFN